MTVKLVEAAPVAGALRFEILSEGRYESGAKVAARQAVRASETSRSKRAAAADKKSKKTAA